MPDSSFHAPRRRRIDGHAGLWKRQLADGSIVYEIKLKQQGVLHSKTLPRDTTRAQAITAWKKASAQRDEGGRPLARDLRLADVAVEALAGLEAKVAVGLRSQRTYDGYASDWARYIAPGHGRMRLSKIEPRVVLAVVSGLREQGLAEWTAHGVITCLRMILRHARHAGYMSSDPFASLSPDELPRQRARESFTPRVLRTAEIERLISATTPTYTPAVTVLAFTGLRLSELAGLRWGDVDLIERVVRVRKQLAPLKRGKDPQLVKTKTRSSVREVPLLDRAYHALLVQLQSEQAKGLGGESAFVFTSVTGRPLGKDRIAKRGVRSAAIKAGLGEGVGPQVLRRSVATATAHAKLPVVVAAAMTGHSPAVYDAHYAKPFRDEEERLKVRESLASIGFGNARVDQPLTKDPSE